VYQDGWCVWITGLPGSGKSTIALALLKRLKKEDARAPIVSSDMLRKVITPVPTYSEKERDRVYAAIVFVAKLLTQNGVNVIIDATANRRRYRDQARRQIPRFMEVYVRCPLEVCVQREAERREYKHAPQDIYKKAFEKRSLTVPGIGAPYEEPLKPEVTLDSDKLNPEQCAKKIFDVLKETFGLAS